MSPRSPRKGRQPARIDTVDHAASNSTASAMLGQAHPWMRTSRSPYVCPIPACHKANASFSTLVRHVVDTPDQAHRSLFRCPARSCEKYLYGLNALIDHIMRSSNDIGHRILHFCKCLECGKDLILSALKRHIAMDGTHRGISDKDIYYQLEQLSNDVSITDGLELSMEVQNTRPDTPQRPDNHVDLSEENREVPNEETVSVPDSAQLNAALSSSAPASPEQSVSSPAPPADSVPTPSLPPPTTTQPERRSAPISSPLLEFLTAPPSASHSEASLAPLSAPTSAPPLALTVTPVSRPLTAPLTVSPISPSSIPPPTTSSAAISVPTSIPQPTPPPALAPMPIPAPLSAPCQAYAMPLPAPVSTPLSAPLSASPTLPSLPDQTRSAQPPRPPSTHAGPPLGPTALVPSMSTSGPIVPSMSSSGPAVPSMPFLGPFSAPSPAAISPSTIGISSVAPITRQQPHAFTGFSRPPSGEQRQEMLPRTTASSAHVSPSTPVTNPPPTIRQSPAFHQAPQMPTNVLGTTLPTQIRGSYVGSSFHTIAWNRAPVPAKLQVELHQFLSASKAYDEMSNSEGLLTNEVFRRQLLYNAVLYCDYFYLLVHQIMCNWDTRPEGLQRVLQRPITAVTAATFKDIIDYKNEARATFKAYWGVFPAGAVETTNDLLYQQYLAAAMQFLDKLAGGYNILLRICKHHSRPPLVREMVSHLFTGSVSILSNVHYVIMSRVWNTKDRETIRLGLDIFNRDFNENIGPSHLPRTAQTSTADSTWAYQYDNVFRRLQAQRHAARMAQMYPQGSSAGSSPALSGGQQNIPNPQGVSLGDTVQGGSNIQGQWPNDQMQLSRGGLRANGTYQQLAARPARQSISSTHGMVRQPATQQIPVRQNLLPNASASLAISGSPIPPNVFAPASEDPFFPTQRVVGQMLIPSNPVMTASPEAQLRSPILKPVELPDDDKGPMYRYIDGFMLPPQSVTTFRIHQEWRFAVSAEELSARAQQQSPPEWTGNASSNQSDPPTWLLKQGSRSFRFRCNHGAPPLGGSLSSWAVTDTAWPDGLTFRLNGADLEPHRKPFIGRSLPIDVTFTLMPGLNTLSIYSRSACAVPPPQQKPTDPVYSVAIESVRAYSHAAVTSGIQTRTTTPSTTVDAIRTALIPKDDDIACLSTTLPIRLADPILGISIWRVPVRGATCRHREAFDLETFLQTRGMVTSETTPAANRGAEPIKVSKVDVWECPICGADARPDALSVDGWLVGVREILERRGELDQARVVEVDENGVREIRKEGLTGTRGRKRSASESEGHHNGNSGVGVRKEREVIMLDDE